MTKTCARCKVEQPLENFGKDPRMRLGRKSYCRPCYSSWAREKYQSNLESSREGSRLRSKSTRLRLTLEQRRVSRACWQYNITPDEYYKLLQDQEGKCAVCSASSPGGRGGWHVDHDHDSQEVRALLCATCNVGLGMFGDDLSRLRLAVEYLERFEQ